MIETVYIGSLVWNVFTSVYLVYKFTSFFSWMYNSFVIMRKIKNGLCWTKNKILGFTKRYSKTPREEVLLDKGHYTELTEVIYSPKNNDDDKMTFSRFVDKETKYNSDPLSESNLLIERAENVYNKKNDKDLTESNLLEEMMPPFANKLIQFDI